MADPVDLTNLRSMTDGDKEMEKELFKEFFSSFEIGIASLQVNMEEEAAETWRNATHSLKGIALNLGAMELGNLCKKGQDEYQANKETKNILLQAIQKEYSQVRGFLLNLVSV